MTVRAVKQALREIGENQVTFEVHPQLHYFQKPPPCEDWRAPLVTINDEVFSQGVVPRVDDLVSAIKTQLTPDIQPAEAAP